MAAYTETVKVYDEYDQLNLEHLNLIQSVVFNKLRHKRIRPHQVTVENSLKIFALELKKKNALLKLVTLQQKLGFFPVTASGFLTDIFPGLLENLKMSGRYWVSWYTSNLPENGVTVWPEELKIWNTGSAGDRDTLCAAVETSPDFTLIDFWQNLITYFPDADVRFCTVIREHETLGDRFPGYDPERCTLKAPKCK